MQKKQILESIYQKFRERTGYGIVIGVEQEFYIGDQCLVASGQDELIANLNAKLALFPFFSALEKERGEGQFEVQIYPTDNPAVMAEMVELLRGVIRDAGGRDKGIKEDKNFNLHPSFLAKPFPDQPGSALHININLTDSSGKNLFMKEGEGESEIFEQSITGLLELLPASVKYFSPYEGAYVRYTEHGMESPSTISWGPDNRTVALRVPSAPIAKHTRHIEHRLPCADADPYLVIAAIIAGIEFGLVNKLENKHPKIWGNAFLPQYNLPKLPQSLYEAESIRNEYLEGVMKLFA